MIILQQRGKNDAGQHWMGATTALNYSHQQQTWTILTHLCPQTEKFPATQASQVLGP